MDKDNPFAVKRLSANNEYYSNVFKKTERTVSVVFYILSYIERTEQAEFHIKVMSEKAMQVHEASLATLSLYEYEAREKIFPFQQALVALEGSFRIANAARILNDEVLVLLLTEVDLVQRYLRNHFATQLPMSVQEYNSRIASPSEPVRSSGVRLPRENVATRPSRVNIPKGDISSDAHMVYSQLEDRSSRIKTVLEAKPEATIKDIAEVITDVSEKTIQRELNSLIEKGQVIRQGERRWSKYSVRK
jgi:DNA-binding transcriptional ArsR family regulator